MIGNLNSAYLPPLEFLIEMIPLDLSMGINPQELVLSDGHFIQEMTIQEHEWIYGSDGHSSCYTVEEIPCVSNQDLLDLPEEDYLYNDFYTWTAQDIRDSDTNFFAPPLMRNTSILSVLDNHQPPICHTDLDLSFEPYEAETETPCDVNLSWEDNQYFGSDILSIEEVLFDEEVIVLAPTKENRAKEEKKKIKKTRKNYSPDIIDILMDWYLIHNGVVPKSSERKMLAQKTGKSEAQIVSWYQNAKKRHIKKLQQYKALSSEYPDLDYRTLKQLLKMKK